MGGVQGHERGSGIWEGLGVMGGGASRSASSMHDA